MTNDEIFEFLKQQEAALLEKPKFYVHYDPKTNNIISFRNYLDTTDSSPYFELSKEDLDVDPSKFEMSSYKVKTENGKFKLEKIVVPTIQITKIDEFIYEIPKLVLDTKITGDEYSYDLLIEQNNFSKKFKIRLSKLLREKFSLQNRDTHVLCLYVTAVNDPNILYKTLKCTMGDLITNEFYTLAFDDFQGDQVNIYGLKYFEEYLHVDIR
jgi:hypothetical protein